MAKTKTGAAFGIDADPTEFDIEEWLSGASLPARTVKIYRDAGRRAEYDELEQRFLLAQSKINLDEEKGLDDSLAVSAPVTEVYELAKQMQQLLAELESSALSVKVRALTHDEDEKIKADVKKSGLSNDQAVYERTATAVLYPRLTPSQWAKMRAAIGEVQFNDILTALVELAGFASGGQVMPDFSHAASGLLSTKGR